MTKLAQYVKRDLLDEDVCYEVGSTFSLRHVCLMGLFWRGNPRSHRSPVCFTCLPVVYLSYGVIPLLFVWVLPFTQVLHEVWSY